MRLIDFVYHSTLGSRVIKKKKLPERQVLEGLVAAQQRDQRDGAHVAHHVPLQVEIIFIELMTHPAGNPGANLKSFSHRCYFREAVFD